MGQHQALRQQYLTALGIYRWERRRPATPASGAVEPAPVPPAPAGKPAADIRRMGWEVLEPAVRACANCALHRGRTQAVFGVGNRAAQWLFVGEAPGAEEDRQGQPFVGAAGQLLNAMLAAIGLKREEVYIANVLKCRPPNNRDPEPQEVERCEPYLMRQIELIGPKIIVALGRFAAHSLLKTDVALGKLRGRRLACQDIPLVVTYHPAYLLRNPLDKRRAWEDLCLAKSVIATL